ncbi:MAG TPA: hypothetical protein VFV08_06050 [Puia sp.]|nr:hypothetical protein [Puia sp.]
MELEPIKIEVIGVGIDPYNPSRWDIVAKNVQGGFCAYSTDKKTAEAWRDSIQAVVDKAYKLGQENPK